MQAPLQRLLVVGCLLITVACSGEENNGGEADRSPPWSVAGELAEVPDAAQGETLSLTTADLDLATELAGVQRPGTGATADQLLEWVSALVGPPEDARSSVFIERLPALFDPVVRDPEVDGELISELGWSLLDVGSYTQVYDEDRVFTLLTGAFDEEAINDAQGERVDGTWRLGEDDYGNDFRAESAVRPSGESLRTALVGERLAVAGGSAPLGAWLDSEATSLADDEALLQVATELDRAGPYVAGLVRGEFAQPPAEELGIPGGVLEPFGVLGFGVGIDDDGAFVTLAYHHETPALATANASGLDQLLRAGSTGFNDVSWREIFSVEEISRSSESSWRAYDRRARVHSRCKGSWPDGQR